MNVSVITQWSIIEVTAAEEGQRLVWRCAGKACVITGATSGIGLATARLFRSHGGRLAIMARDSQPVHATAAGLGPDAVTVTCDVARAGDLTALMRAANDACGGIDVAVANAGIGRSA